MAALERGFVEIDDEHDSAMGHTLRPDDPLEVCCQMRNRWREMLHDLDRWFRRHPPRQCVDALPSFREGCFSQFEELVAELEVRPPASTAHWIHSMQQLDLLLQHIMQNALFACLRSAGETTDERVQLSTLLMRLHADTNKWRQRCEIALGIKVVVVSHAQITQPTEMEWREQPSGLHIEEVTTDIEPEDELEPQ